MDNVSRQLLRDPNVNPTDKIIEDAISNETKELIENTKPNGKMMKFLPIVFDIYNEQYNNFHEIRSWILKVHELVVAVL